MFLQLESDAAPDTAETLVTPRPFPAGIPGDWLSGSALCSYIFYFSLQESCCHKHSPVPKETPRLGSCSAFPKITLVRLWGRSLPCSSKKDQNKEDIFSINKTCPSFIS